MNENEIDIPLDEIGYYDYAARLGMPYFHWGGIRATDRLVELLGITSDSDVLMVGCGTGYTACHIAKETGCSLTGVDISPIMIKRAKERLEEWELEDQVMFVEGDAYELQFDNESFDSVMTEFVTVFLRKAKVFGEYYRVLKKGGKVGINELYIEDNTPPSSIEKIKKAQEGFEKAIGLPLVIPTLNQWKEYFSSAGFEKIEQEKVDYKYSYREMISITGFGRLMRMSGRTLLDMAKNKQFRKRMWPVGKLKDILVRDKETRKYSGAVLCIGHKMQPYSS